MFLNLLDISIIYRVSGNNRQIFHGQVKRTKLSRKILYHFVSFPIVNEILILILILIEIFGDYFQTPCIYIYIYI